MTDQQPTLSIAREALHLRAQADRMLAALGIMRDGTDLVGQLGAKLVADAFGGQLESVVRPYFDVRVGNLRVEVKARKAERAARHLHVWVRGLEVREPAFDALVYVQFDPVYDVVLARRYSYAQVAEHAARAPGGRRRLIMSPRLLDVGEDVTDRITAAYDELGPRLVARDVPDGDGVEGDTARARQTTASGKAR
jgi:hypothetical protein